LQAYSNQYVKSHNKIIHNNRTFIQKKKHLAGIIQMFHSYASKLNIDIIAWYLQWTCNNVLCIILTCWLLTLSFS